MVISPSNRNALSLKTEGPIPEGEVGGTEMHMLGRGGDQLYCLSFPESVSM